MSKAISTNPQIESVYGDFVELVDGNNLDPAKEHFSIGLQVLDENYRNPDDLSSRFHKARFLSQRTLVSIKEALNDRNPVEFNRAVLFIDQAIEASEPIADQISDFDKESKRFAAAELSYTQAMLGRLIVAQAVSTELEATEELMEFRKADFLFETSLGFIRNGRDYKKTMEVALHGGRNEVLNKNRREVVIQWKLIARLSMYKALLPGDGSFIDCLDEYNLRKGDTKNPEVARASVWVRP